MRRLQLPPSFKNNIQASSKNFMILDAKLEEAFDAMKISFCPPDVLHPNSLYLRIWDSSCRGDVVDSGGTIEDYEGSLLQVPASWVLSKRALSYHNLCCYIYSRYMGRYPLEEPPDFSSQSKEGNDKVRVELAGLFHSAIRQDKAIESDSEVDQQECV